MLETADIMLKTKIIAHLIAFKLLIIQLQQLQKKTQIVEASKRSKINPYADA